MRISIAMATYNGAKYLQEQLDSFLCQTRQPDEFVVCDDGSTDATLAILDDFRLRVPFSVRIYRNEKNLGYIKNFENALSLCTGDVIFLSDQDDVWFSNKLSAMVAVLEMRPDIFVLQTDMVLAGEDLTPSPYTQLGNILSLGYRPETFITGCGTVLRKTWLDLVLPIPADVAAHDDWIHRLAVALGVRALHEKPLQYYRRHGGNASNWGVSQLAKMSNLDSLRAHGFLDATDGWKREHNRVRATWRRLDERYETVKDIGLADRQPWALFELDRQTNALCSRIQNMTLSRFKRFPRLLIMWMRGGYSQFAGWKSVVKDILRP